MSRGMPERSPSDRASRPAARLLLALTALSIPGCTSGGDHAARGPRDAGEKHDGAVGSLDAAWQEPGDARAPVDAGDGDADEARDGGPQGLEERCVIFLHGKSGAGFATQRTPQHLFVGPTGNADGWGGKQWLYFPEAQLGEVRAIIGKVIRDNACGKVIVHGFSNGAAAAAKLYCQGDDFEGRVLGYVIDDPVPDHGADSCSPHAGVKARLYWTGALTPTDGWSCQEADWTCEGGKTVGITRYAANLKLQRTQSVKSSHEPYTDPPEYLSWR